MVMIFVAVGMVACGPKKPSTDVSSSEIDSKVPSSLIYDDKKYMECYMGEPRSGEDVKYFSNANVYVIIGDSYNTQYVTDVTWNGKFENDAKFIKGNTYTVEVRFDGSYHIADYLNYNYPQGIEVEAFGYKVIKLEVENAHWLLTLEYTVDDFYVSKKSDKCDHKLVTEDDVASLYDSTCVKAGYICKVCSCGYHREFEDLPLGEHQWKLDLECEDLDIDFRTYAATCTEDGLEVDVCTVCLETMETVIPAKGHNYIENLSQSVAATCTADGKKVSECEYCQDVLTETVKAKGHVFKNGNFNEVQEPTCTESGIKANVCSICKQTIIKTIEATGHDYSVYVQTSNYSTHDVVCSKCGDVQGQEAHVPDANEHCIKCGKNLQIN